MISEKGGTAAPVCRVFCHWECEKLPQEVIFVKGESHVFGLFWKGTFWIS